AAAGPRGEPRGRLHDDDPVVIAVSDFAWHETDSAELDLDVVFTRAGLCALAGVRTQCFDADVDGAQRGGIADDAVDDEAGPAIGVAQARDHVADERGVQRPASVDHQHAAVAGLREHGFEQRVVLEATDGVDRAREHRSPTELVELSVTAADVGTDVVDKVCSGARYYRVAHAPDHSPDSSRRSSRMASSATAAATT